MREAIVLCCALPCFAQLPVSNIERLEMLADSLAGVLCGQLSGWSRLQLVLEPHPARWLLEHALVRGLSLCGHQLYSAEADTLPRLTIAIADVGVSYEPVSSERVRRTVRWHVLGTLRLPDGRLLALPSWRTAAHDTLARSSLPQVDQPSYSFGSAPMPEPHSLWRELLEPALAVGTGAVILLLLFTLRSR